MLAVLAALLVVGSGYAPKAYAQPAAGPLAGTTATKLCAQPFTGGTQNPTGTPLVTDCTVTITIPALPAGTVVTPIAAGGTGISVDDIMLDPNACFTDVVVTNGAVDQSALTAATCVRTSERLFTGAVPPAGGTTAPLGGAIDNCFPTGSTIATGGSAANPGAITITCILDHAIIVTGPTSLCEELDITGTFSTGTAAPFGGFIKVVVCPPNPPTPPTPVNPLTGVTVTKTCTPPFTNASDVSPIVTDCTLVFKTTSNSGVFNNGTHLEFDTILDVNATFTTVAAGGGGDTTNGCENGVGGGGVLSSDNTTYTCIVGPIKVFGPTTLCEFVQLVDPRTGFSSDKIRVCPQGVTPQPVNALTFNATKSCTPFVPSTVTGGGTSVTDCTLDFTPTAGNAFPSDVFVADDTITSGNAGFSVADCIAPLGSGPTTTGGVSSVFNCIELVGTAHGGFCLDSPSTGVLQGFHLICHLPPIVVSSLPNTLCETVELGSASLGFSNKVQVCPPAPSPTPSPIVSNLNQPTGEQKTCTNTTSVGGLSQVIGASTQPLAVSGPGTSFTIPAIGPASTCAIQLTRGGTPCNLTSNTCADGFVVVTLTTPGTTVAIACGSTATPTGQTLPPVSGGAGTCQPQDQGQQLFIPCGTTATTLGTVPTTQSNTCTGVLFDIQSLIGACLNSPTTACVPGTLNGLNFTNFQGGTATVTVNFIAVGAPTGGTVGGINLGTNQFTLAAPGVGTLLVTATPAAIPSNGTLASVITATFACGTGFSVVNGIPLSNLLTGTTSASNATFIANQPILGNGSAVCGAGLPGTFNFSTNGPVIFDNGRQLESVNCGAGGNVSPFGVGSTFFPSNQTTFPVVLSCTGAAVLAIGAGVAGDAAINVTYTSAIGGLTAVGSTLLTVVPSGVPRISVVCNPSTIAAGSTGSICTATVTDINGVPLNGLTGATVTWTTSDPANTSILPCLVNIPGNINITTSPNIIPQITPNTPCQVPTAQIPGQNNTFLNGQASALLVASPTAHPETVTVTASLGVLIPPSFSCLVAPFLPTGFGTTTTPFAPVTGVGLPAVSGCGTANPVGFSGLASAFSGSSLGLTGIVTLPNTTSASTTVNIGGVAGILIAGAGPNTPVQLGRGCNQVIVTTTVGTPIANIAALVSPASAVVSIWRFSNSTKQFQAGFFSDPNAPTDFATTGAISGTQVTGTTALPGTSGNQITETYFICVNQAATITSG